MPFAKSIRVTIEHGDASRIEADYSSVAYFYQDEPHAPFPPFPTDPSQLLPAQSIP
jgi:D-arabinan exo alpha-(1,3)/(1,5)-arabinofuranosidase (non-reducing end)